MVAEIVREKILLQTQEEIPYVTAVVVEKWDDERDDFTRIHCAIFVERASQKKIVIGKGASRLKEIGISAREDIEHLLGHRCHLELFVKVEEEWRNNEFVVVLDDEKPNVRVDSEWVEEFRMRISGGGGVEFLSSQIFPSGCLFSSTCGGMIAW